MHRIVIVFVIAAAVMSFVFSSAEWYANEAAVPRYCEDHENVIKRVRLILTRNEPVGSGSKRPFIIAAKLIFLVPKKAEESTASYISRLTRHIDRVCNRI